MTRTRAIVTLLLLSTGSFAVAVTLLAGRGEPVRPAAGGEQTGTGTVVGSAPAGAAKNAPPDVFTISGRVAGLLPGRPGTLALRVTNPNPYPINVVTLDTSVAEPAGCPDGSLRVGRYDSARATAVTVLARATVDVPVAVELVDSPTADQSACAGATFGLEFSGTAVRGR